MSFSLKLFGGVALEGEHGLLSGPAVQRHRLALLVQLATARTRTMSRDKLIGVLWPEREPESARRLLNQAVHALRQALGSEAIISSGDELQLDRVVVRCDVVAFEEALAAGEPARAVAHYTGPFLDGFFLDDAPEFERWGERERDRLAGRYARALEELADTADRANDLPAALEWWRARAAHDPFDSRVALHCINALERVGNRAGALQHAVQHQRLLRQELAVEPPREVQAAINRLRSEQPTTQPVPSGAEAPPLAPEPDLPARMSGVSVSTPTRQPRRRALQYGIAIVLLLALAGGAVRISARSRTASPTSSTAVDEIARAVARELQRRESGDTQRSVPRQRTRSLAAYELYLRGEDPTLIRSDSGARRGLEYFRQAVALDPNYAAAWVGIARFTVRAAPPNPAARARAFAESEAAAARALALDDSLADAHALMGVLRARALDYAGAEPHFRRALELEPGRARPREWFVAFLLLTGRPREALAEAERMIQIDPLSATAVAELARALAANGRCDEALERLESIRHVKPPPLRVAAIAAQCHARQGHFGEAIGSLRPQAERDSGVTLALLGYMIGRAGRHDEARAIQARLLERWRRDSLEPVMLAYVPAGLGDRNEAFKWLDRAFEDGSLRFAPGVWVDFADPPFDVLEGDPRLAGLRERMGLQKR
jgi:DNA-binding SARP family transcriptional activator